MLNIAVALEMEVVLTRLMKYHSARKCNELIKNQIVPGSG